MQLDPPALVCQDQSFERLNNHASAVIALLDTRRVERCHYQLNLSDDNIQQNSVLVFPLQQNAHMR